MEGTTTEVYEVQAFNLLGGPKGWRVKILVWDRNGRFIRKETVAGQRMTRSGALAVKATWEAELRRRGQTVR